MSREQDLKARLDLADLAQKLDVGLAGAAPTEPLTDLLNLVEAARAQRLVQEHDRMTAECHALIDQLRAQFTAQQAAILKDLEFALARLRHAYAQLTAHEKRWSRRGMQSFADGLLAPQIRRLEKVARLLGVKERRND